jgi:hypothetical protein
LPPAPHRARRAGRNTSSLNLGKKLAPSLTVKDVDEYRTKRLAETTRRKKAPSLRSVDRELELVKRWQSLRKLGCGGRI